MLSAGHGRGNLALAVVRLEEQRRRKDAAYKLLLAYAECEQATVDKSSREVFAKHGYDGTFMTATGFLQDLRTRALAAAKEAE